MPDAAKELIDVGIVENVKSIWPAVLRRKVPAGDFRKLLEALVEEGNSAGNKTLRDKLGWKAKDYFDIRNRLVELGFVARGLGKGGSTKINRDDINELLGIDLRPEPPAEPAAEADLYDPIYKKVLPAWALDKGLEWWQGEITAFQGRRDTGGRWSRPDLAVVSVNHYPFLPNRSYLDLWTFEVKIADAVDVTAVYEALAHRRYATRSYLVYPAGVDEETERRILAEAGRVGVGVYRFDAEDDYETWIELREAAESPMQPAMTNAFIAAQFSPSIRSQLQAQLNIVEEAG